MAKLKKTVFSVIVFVLNLFIAKRIPPSIIKRVNIPLPSFAVITAIADKIIVE